MAVRGTESKKIVTGKIMEMFEGAFINGKELRIPMLEDNEPIEIKITLTAAKDCIKSNPVVADTPAIEKTFVEPTQEEKDRMEMLFNNLGQTY